MFIARLGLSVVVLVLTATLVNGASTGGVLTGLLINKLHEFRTGHYAKRQGSNNSGLSLDDFPQQCQSGCSVAVNAFNTCTSPSCLCTGPVDASLNNCINCTVKVLPDPTIIQDGQNVFNTYNSLCGGTGVQSLSLTAVTLSSTASASSSAFVNPFLPPTTTALPTVTTPLGPTATISNIPGTTNTLPPNSIVGNPSATTSVTSNPLKINNAVALPRASKAYAAVGLVIAFFMCLA